MPGSQRGVEGAVKGPSQTAQEAELRSVWVEGQEVEGQEGNRVEGQEEETRSMRRKESRRGEGGK